MCIGILRSFYIIYVEISCHLIVPLRMGLKNQTIMKRHGCFSLSFIGWFHAESLGVSKTDSTYQDDIFPGNICPYQEYLNCYWPNFDKALKTGSWEHLEHIPMVRVIFVQVKFVLTTITLKARSRQSLDRNRTGLRQCQGKVNARSMQGRGKVKARSSQCQHNGKAMSRQCWCRGNVKARSRKGWDKFRSSSWRGQGEV